MIRDKFLPHDSTLFYANYDTNSYISYHTCIIYIYHNYYQTHIFTIIYLHIYMTYEYIYTKYINIHTHKVIFLFFIHLVKCDTLQRNIYNRKRIAFLHLRAIRAYHRMSHFISIMISFVS